MSGFRLSLRAEGFGSQKSCQNLCRLPGEYQRILGLNSSTQSRNQVPSKVQECISLNGRSVPAIYRTLDNSLEHPLVEHIQLIRRDPEIALG